MNHRDFWNREYKTGEHLALSDVAAEDLKKFTRWLERQTGREFLNPLSYVLDLGCGNGRNLMYLAEEFGIRGAGYDVSDVAIANAKRAAGGLPLSFETRSIEETFPQRDNSVTIALDMMTSHFLKKEARETLLSETVRVLKPGGWLFFKSFLADEDAHTKRLLKEHPADESGAYIHPEFGLYEYVWTEDNAIAFFEPHFEIQKVEKSHRHLSRGRANKRRTISLYLQKN